MQGLVILFWESARSILPGPRTKTEIIGRKEPFHTVMAARDSVQLHKLYKPTESALIKAFENTPGI